MILVLVGAGKNIENAVGSEITEGDLYEQYS